MAQITTPPLNLPAFTWRIAELHDLRVALAAADGQLQGLESVLNLTSRSTGKGRLGLSDYTQINWQRPKNHFSIKEAFTSDEQLKLEAFYFWNENPLVNFDPTLQFSTGLYWLNQIFQNSLQLGLVTEKWSRNCFKDFLPADAVALLSTELVAFISASPPIEPYQPASNFDLTRWHQVILKWLIQFYSRLQIQKQTELSRFKLNLFFNQFDLNRRQRSILSILSESSHPETGGLRSITNRELVQMFGASRESLKRDLAQLLIWNLIEKNNKGGRSTAYVLKSNDELV